MSDSLFSNVRYLAINEKDENWGLSINTVGFQSILPHSVYPPKGHPSEYWFNPSLGRTLHEYQVIYITKGEGFFNSADTRNAPLDAGKMMLLFPGTWHTYYPDPEKGWDTYWIGFNGKFPDNLINHQFFTRKQAVLDIGFNEQLVYLFNEAIQLAKLEKSGFQQALSGITINLLGMIYYILQNNLFEDKDIVLKIERARMIMREHPCGDVCLEDIATTLNMSYSWFRKTFKQYTGLSPAQYQSQIKLQKAKEMLVTSTMSVKEIAYLLDFQSPNYFTSFFKEKTGYSPLVFRDIRHGKIGDKKAGGLAPK